MIGDGTDPTAGPDLSTVSLNYSLYDQNGRYWTFDIYGYVEITTSSALDNGFDLRVGDNYYRSRSPYVAARNMDGRQLSFNTQVMGDLLVSRRAYVPSSGGAFVRYLEILENPTDRDVTTTVALESSYAGGSATEVVTESGSSTLTSADGYIVLRNTANASTPTVLHYFRGPNARSLISPQSSAASGNGNYQVRFDVTVPAGERRILMHFATLDGSVEQAEANLQMLRTLDALAINGLSAEDQASVVNFYAYTDSDLDGLSDEEELLLGTLPDNPDTDGDGVADGLEILLGRDPTVAEQDALARVHGQVVNALGAGVSDATVHLGNSTVTTDEQGYYEFSNVAISQPQVSLHASIVINDVTVSSEPVTVALQYGIDSIAVQPILLQYQGSSIEVEEITGENLGVGISLSDDSSRYVAFSEGFIFPFYGRQYSSLYIGSNGYLTFGSGDSSHYYNGEHQLGQLPRIAPYWNDLNPYGRTTIYYRQHNDRFEVTWYRISNYGSSSSANTFRVSLYPTGDIVMQWGQLQSDGRYIFTGISPANGQPSTVVDLSEHQDSEAFAGALYEHFQGDFDLANQHVIFQAIGAGYSVSNIICEDSDGDRLCDIEELLRGTDIHNPDTDGDNLDDSRDPEPFVPDTEAPVVALVAPQIDEVLVAGSEVRFELAIDEAGYIEAIEANINGVAVDASNTKPYRIEAIVPIADVLRLEVVAIDQSGNRSIPLIQEFNIEIPSHFEIEGSVIAEFYGFTDGVPGLTISVEGADASGLSEQWGDFYIDSVSTYVGEFYLRITGQFEGQSIDVRVGPYAPLPGGSVSVGTLYLNDYLDDDWVDTDGDGLYDILEVIIGSNALDADTDGDGLHDFFEFWYGFDLWSGPDDNEAQGDEDGDGLTNLEEQELGTDPYAWDTDGDQLSDGVEKRYGTNPTLADSDADGVDDFRELFGDFTDPNNAASRLDDFVFFDYEMYIGNSSWGVNQYGTLYQDYYFGPLGHGNGLYVDGSSAEYGGSESAAFGYESDVYKIGIVPSSGEFRFRPWLASDSRVAVSRRVVPSDEGDVAFIRVIDVFTNIATENVVIEVESQEYYRSSGWLRVLTSNGDGRVDENDHYFIVEDQGNTDRNLYIHVLGNEEGELKASPDTEVYSGSNYSYLRHRIALAPGETKMLMRVLTTASDLTAATAQANELQALPEAVYRGLSWEEAQAVQNFKFDLTPKVWFSNLEHIAQPVLSQDRLQIQLEAPLADTVDLYVNGTLYSTSTAQMSHTFEIVVPDIKTAGAKLRLKAVAKGYEGRSAETEVIELAVAESTAVSGQLVYQEEGQLKPAVNISVRRADGSGTVQTDSAGRFTIVVPLDEQTLLAAEGFVGVGNNIYVWRELTTVAPATVETIDVGQFELVP